MRLKTRMTLALPILLAAAACSVPSDRCAGWEAVRLGSASVDYLAANDPQALKELIAHHQFGQSQGCWK